MHNLEIQRRQYGLADRARQLGWTAVEIIGDDLGRSGGGIARPGFERLLATICDGRVGAVLAIEASRLARNGRDWHTLIEFCGLVGTIIVDEDGIYVPAAYEDTPPASPAPLRRSRSVQPGFNSSVLICFKIEEHPSGPPKGSPKGPDSLQDS